MKKVLILVSIIVIAAGVFTSCAASDSNVSDTTTIAPTESATELTPTTQPVDTATSTPTPTQEPVAVDTPVDPDIPDFSGSWFEIFAHRGYLTLEQDGYNITVTGTWPSSANEIYEYSFSGVLDPDTYTMEYSNGICTINTYESVDTYTTATGYENGTGRLVFTEEGLEWYDDMNDADDLGMPSYFNHTASVPSVTSAPVSDESSVGSNDTATDALNDFSDD